jgi:lipopolysaccharide export system permease protein
VALGRAGRLGTGAGQTLNTISRYMFGRLVGASALVAAVIAALHILRKSVSLYGLVMGGTISAGQLIAVWLHVLPVVFYHATPEIVSIAVAWMYHRWIENNEVMTLRSAGLSWNAIARPGVMVALLAATVCAANSLWLLPPSWRAVEDIRRQALAHIGIDGLQPGYQQEIVPGVSLSFAERADGGGIKDVVVLDRRPEHNAVDVWALKGSLASTGGDPVLWLEHGVYLVRRGAAMDRVVFETFSLPLDVGLFGPAASRNDGLYEQKISRLLNPPSRIRHDPLRGAEWRTEGHRRLITPLLCCGSVLLVLGLLIPGEQKRGGGKIRFALAIVMALATNTLPNPLFEMAIRHIELLPLFYLLPALPALAGVLLLAHGDGHRLRLRLRGRNACTPLPRPALTEAV